MSSPNKGEFVGFFEGLCLAAEVEALIATAVFLLKLAKDEETAVV